MEIFNSLQFHPFQCLHRTNWIRNVKRFLLSSPLSRIYVNRIKSHANPYKSIIGGKYSVTKRNNPAEKYAKDLNGHFLKEDLQIANNQMKKNIISL